RCSLRQSLCETQPRSDDAGTHWIRPLPWAGLELERASSRDRHDQVESVEQRARQLVAIASEPLCRAAALRTWVTTRSARAQIHRADELKPGREPHAAGRARDDELAVLERLAQRFERRTLELRQLVEQQHSSMRTAA